MTFHEIRQQTILIKYYALFFIFWKSRKIWKCCLLQIIGGALWVNVKPGTTYLPDGKWLQELKPSRLQAK